MVLAGVDTVGTEGELGFCAGAVGLEEAPGLLCGVGVLGFDIVNLDSICCSKLRNCGDGPLPLLVVVGCGDAVFVEELEELEARFDVDLEVTIL